MAQLKDLLVNGDAKFLADVILDHDPTEALHAATKAYVDAKAGTGTDEKLKVAALTSGTTYLPILAISTDSGTAATRQIDKDAQAFKYICTPGTSGGSTKGTAQLILGNGISEGYVNSAAGQLTIFGNAMYGVTLKYGAAYSGQTLMLPAPTDASQTNYLLSKIGSAAVGSATQPVYVDSGGHVQVANENRWGFSSQGGVVYPYNVSTTSNTFNAGSLTMLGNEIQGITGIKTGQSTINILAENHQDLAASTNAGVTSYTMIGVQDIGAVSSTICAENIYYYSVDGLNVLKPTSVSSDGKTLTFASTLNPNNSITVLSFANYDEQGRSILSGAGLTNTRTCNVLVGAKLYNTGYFNLNIGQLNYSGGQASFVVGARNYTNANFTLTTGFRNTNIKTGAFVSGQWHDTTNGPDYLVAVGQYSSITSTSAFVVGNGTATDARSNAFEVTITGTAKVIGLQIGASSEIKSIGSGLSVDANGALYATNATTGTVTGSGINGYLAKWTGADGQSVTELTVGPAIGTSTTTYLREDGTWATPATVSHAHGDIDYSGAITTNPGTTIASGDALLIADSSLGNTIKKSATTFGTSTTTYLRNDGTWGTPAGTDTKVTQSAITGTSTTSLYPLLLAYGTGQTATTTNTANFTANASISPSGDLWVNKATSSTTFNYGANAYTQYNSTLKAIEFCFA